MTDSVDLKARVEALTPVQRERLAARLGLSVPRRLVAYVVLRDESISKDALRETVGRRLPEHMVPSSIVATDALPRLPNGKLDQVALAAQFDATATAGTSAADGEPRDDVERTLCSIWAEVLALDEVQINDNYYEIGGDSIATIHILSRAKGAQLDFTPQDIIDHPTVASLADVIRSRRTQSARDEETIPLAPAQRQLLSSDESLPALGQAIVGQLPSTIDAKRLGVALDVVLAGHEALRLRPVFDDGEWTQRVHSAPTIGLEQVELGEVTIEQTVEDMRRSLSLDANQGLFRAAIVRQHESRWLVMAAHRWIIDAPSWPILLRALEGAYADSIDAASQPDGIFSRWASSRYEDHPWVQFSKRSDPPRSKGRTSFESVVPSNIAESLLGSSNRVYNTTVTDLLLTAVARASLAWASAEMGVLRIAMNIDGRTDQEKHTVGPFVSRVPLNLRARIDDPVGDAIKSTKEQVRGLSKRGVTSDLLPSAPGAGDHAAVPAEQIFFGVVDHRELGTLLDSPLWSENTDPNHESPQGTEFIEVQAVADAAGLRIRIGFPEALYDLASMRQLAEKISLEAANIVAHCESGPVGGFTPSDFPEADLDQESLDELFE